MATTVPRLHGGDHVAAALLTQGVRCLSTLVGKDAG
jgi:hypothetical protein